MNRADLAIIGGGIIGLATAYRYSHRFPDDRIVLLEKEQSLALHQTGRNSGVLHSGIYYEPGSLKAKNCREGKRAMQDFCDRESIDFEICGKVIVAVDESELPALQRIYERGQANGVQCEVISQDRLAELEPHVQGVKAIHVPESGIVNYTQVCERLAERVQERGGHIVTGTRVVGLRSASGTTVLETTTGEFEAKTVINCAGLYSDRVTRLSGDQPSAKIVPFRGEYFELRPEVHHLCRNLIYPVPDPSFPFLGVHFTRMVEGGVECGPNAVLAFAREGYQKLDIDLKDLVEALTYPGFIRLATRHWRSGLGEMWRSFSKQAFVRALQRLCPEIQAKHLEPAPAGVRAQALYPDGGLVDDFVVQARDGIVHVSNAPSPAATASLNIGRLIVDRVAEMNC